ncbi:hypothetical protein DFH06DRAFT_1322852 [Mycena polygramma]|nr:hypothetical protein DFH06DRAFT_1322852 [Mycena polygramma]
MDSLELFVYSTAAICVLAYFVLNVVKAVDLFLPPGPPTRPIIGNIFKLPSTSVWLTLLQWKEEYGDLVYLHGLGNSVLVVNSLVRELLENRWKNYSRRPIFIAAVELMGNRTPALMPYGDE